MTEPIEFAGGADSEQIKELAVVSQVAHMYYNLNMLQPDIAEKMFFSRSKVSRMLKRARELGLVEIKVKRVLDRATNVEQQMRKMFGVKEAIVVTTFDDSIEEVLDVVTDFAALYISSLLRGERIVGLSRGNAITQVVHKMTKVNECNLDAVQLMGSSAHHDISVESRELVNILTRLYGGRSHFLNTPMYVDDLYAKEVLLQDKMVQNTFALMKRCDIILTGLGGFDVNLDNPNWFGYLNERHLSELREKRTVGSICAQYYDVNGQLLPSEWNKKCIAMPFEYINRDNTVIGVAAGPSKVTPILGALRGNLLNTVITDIQTALQVIEQQNQLVKA